MQIQHFFDSRTASLTYVVHRDGIGAVIDPVLDFDAKSGRTWTESADAVAGYIDAQALQIPFVLDTHAHADHLSAMPYFAKRYGSATCIGRGIGQIQAHFREVFNLGRDFPVDGRQFDRLLDDGEDLELGSFAIRAMHTPGHTPACLTYRVEDAAFVGDTLFQPDYGTARCDFPQGSAATLWDSVQRLYALPETTRLFTCHDYQPGGRPVACESSVGEQKRSNVQLDASTSQEAFVRFRRERDATLEMPALILPAIQVNIRAGHLPEPEDNGIAYLKLPVNVFGRGA